jgi:hypothetical protein
MSADKTPSRQEIIANLQRVALRMLGEVGNPSFILDEQGRKVGEQPRATINDVDKLTQLIQDVDQGAIKTNSSTGGQAYSRS